MRNILYLAACRILRAAPRSFRSNGPSLGTCPRSSLQVLPQAGPNLQTFQNPSGVTNTRIVRRAGSFVKTGRCVGFGFTTSPRRNFRTVRQAVNDILTYPGHSPRALVGSHLRCFERPFDQRAQSLVQFPVIADGPCFDLSLIGLIPEGAEGLSPGFQPRVSIKQCPP